MRNVLVTGGAGYIGSHCCKELHRKGFYPIVIDNLITGQKDSLKWGEHILGDIGNYDDLSKCLQLGKIDAVVHFAAHAYVGESVINPMKYYINNVVKTINLIKWVLDNKISYFIFSSSCTVYGIPTTLPIDEKQPLNPMTPYGQSKYIIEKVLDDCDKAHGLKYIILRYFNAAGADPEGEIGENHDPEPHLIPSVLNAAFLNKPIKILGTDYPTKDGTCIRDYVHVTDLSEAHVCALNYLLKGEKSDTFNLGNGRGYSVRDIVEISSKIIGKNIQICETNRRTGDPPELVASNKKAISALGWNLKYSDIAFIVQSAYNWNMRQSRQKN
jgi:UDP-glucose 4-epimerase